MRIKFITLLLVSTLIFACSKEEVNDPKSEDQNENQTLKTLISHGWKFHYEFYLLADGNMSPYSTPPCLLDDSMVYRQDGVYLKFSGVELCAPEQPQVDTLLWSLRGDSALITNNKGLITEKEILILNDDSLMLSSVSPNNDTLAYLYLKY